jgi:hypothetical protein
MILFADHCRVEGLSGKVREEFVTYEACFADQMSPVRTQLAQPF